MIKVAIDSGPLTSGHAVRGIGVMVKEQIEAVKKYGSKEVSLDSFDFASEEGKTKLENENYDVVHYTTFFPYSLTLPTKKYGKKSIVMIQDLIHMIYPKQYPPGIRGALKLLMQKRRLKNIDYVITIAETNKKDIVRLLGFPSEKIEVLYIAPSNIYKVIKDKKRLKEISHKYNLPNKFVFYLGDVNYNKNVLNLMKACEMSGIPLVIAGKRAKEISDSGLISLMDIGGPKDWIRFLLNVPHPENVHYSELLDKLSDPKKVMALGYVPDSDIAEVMNLATVYGHVSYYEGFGLGVVHAYVCGIPTVISRTNSMVEIANGASLIADPDSPEEISRQINRASQDSELRKNLIQKGFERAKFFNYEKVGRELVGVYKKVNGEL